MFFSKTASIYRKSKDAQRVSTWALQGTINCKVVFGSDNKAGFDGASDYNTYRVFTRDETVKIHDKVVIDDDVYIVRGEAQYEGISTDYRVYYVTLSNENIT